MSVSIQEDRWVWVVVQDPGGNEQFLGQHDPEKDIAYIPTFMEKEQAEKCYIHLALQPGHQYEVQAIIYEDLVRYAAKNEFLLFVLDEVGKVLKMISP